MSKDANVDAPTEKSLVKIGGLLSLRNNVAVALYLRSNSLVRRKFKIGANAVGSLSINIWKYGDITESAAVNCGGSQQVLDAEIGTQKRS